MHRLANVRCEFQGFLKKCFHQFSLMGRILIPDQNKLALDIPSEMLQSDDHLFSIDGVVNCLL